jgi:hypothetical protein
VIDSSDMMSIVASAQRFQEQRFQQLEARLVKLEAPRDQQALQTALKSQAAQQQGLNGSQIGQPCERNGLYAPLRSDTKPLIDLAAFARRLLNPDDLGHAVTKEVRDAARRALGMPEVREYDL